MLLAAELNVAITVAEKMTLSGKCRQMQIMPPACRRYRACKSWPVSGKWKIGTVNACGNLKKNCNAFHNEGLDVRRVISCH
jgi:hypothetical protein